MIDVTTSPLDARLQLVDFTKTDANTLKGLVLDTLGSANAFLDDLTNKQGDALAIIDEFNVITRLLGRYFGALSHLNSVLGTDDIRTAHHDVLPTLSAFFSKMGQSTPLFNLYQTAQNSPQAQDNQALKRAIELSLQSFELSGVGLDSDHKKQFADISSRLAVLSAKFSDNALDASQAFALPLTKQQLSGITATGLALLKSAGDTYKAKHPNTLLATDYVATLDVPMYLAVMQYADDRTLRQTLYHAYNTKASLESTFGRSEFDNSATMSEILALRQQKARLLGFDDYTQLSLANKMADDKAQVQDFLLNLAKHATPFAKADLADVEILAKTLGIDQVQAWDVPYLSEKIRQEKYNLNSDELRPYFPLPVVLNGLFDIIGTLFDVRFKAQDIPTWHDDVQFYEVVANDKTIGGIYLDLFARAGKRGGAWLSGFQDKHQGTDGETLPVGFIVGNFSPKTADTPSLLTFDEVTTLFHEFGHGLHHLLTKVVVSDVAGINGVEWDAVELPSQFMENFALSTDGIGRISRHVETGEPLPQDKLTALLNAKNFQSGLQTLRQIEFALFDLRVHGQDVADYDELLSIMNAVRDDVAVIKPPKNNRFANTFSHIFAGGYASGYYSYKWAELLSADAFSRFEKEGVFNPTTGQAFKSEILERGGERPAKENFEAFMGRPADINALLVQSGFVAK